MCDINIQFVHRKKGEAVIICRRKTSFKKRTFVIRRKCVFCCLKCDKRSKIEVKAKKRSANLFFILLPSIREQFIQYPFFITQKTFGYLVAHRVLIFTRDNFSAIKRHNL